jgi:hypothetical protein
MSIHHASISISGRLDLSSILPNHSRAGRNDFTLQFLVVVQSGLLLVLSTSLISLSRSFFLVCFTSVCLSVFIIIDVVSSIHAKLFILSLLLKPIHVRVICIVSTTTSNILETILILLRTLITLGR